MFISVITEPTKLIILPRLFIDLSLQGEILCEEKYKIKITTSIPCLMQWRFSSVWMFLRRRQVSNGIMKVVNNYLQLKAEWVIFPAWLYSAGYWSPLVVTSQQFFCDRGRTCRFCSVHLRSDTWKFPQYCTSLWASAIWKNFKCH